MKKFYFTFGYAHGNADHYQVIFAKSEPEAYEKMRALYGNKWAFCYNQEQWSQSKAEGFFKSLRPLKAEYSWQ